MEKIGDVYKRQDLLAEGFRWFDRVRLNRLESDLGFERKYNKLPIPAKERSLKMCIRDRDNRSQLNSFGNLQAFIFTIAKHQVIDYFRKQVNELQFEDFMSIARTKRAMYLQKTYYCMMNSCNN